MHTFIIAAVSTDGFLADKQDQKSTSWTSKEDFAYFVKKTKQAGVCVMGSSTYKTIGHPLKDRFTLVYTTKTDLLPTLPLDKGELAKVVAQKSNAFSTNLPPSQLINRFTGLTDQLAICGGSSIYTQFIHAGVVDTLYVTYEPIIFGTGIPLFNAPLNQPLKLITTTPLSPQTILLEYRVIKS